MAGRTSRPAGWLPLALLGFALATAGLAGAKEAARPSKALLVLDVQKAYVGPSAEDQAFVDHVNHAIDRTRGKVLTIYVLQEGGGPLDERVHVVSKERFAKSQRDAFTNPELLRLLKRKGIRDVYLVGLDALYCVYSTAMGAQGHGYRVHAVPDALLTSSADRKGALDQLADAGVELVEDGDL